MKKKKHQGTFCYPIANGVAKGLFNIYQGKYGGVFLTMNYEGIQLTPGQVDQLKIDVYALVDFDHDLYQQAYSITPLTGSHREKKDNHAHGDSI